MSGLILICAILLWPIILLCLGVALRLRRLRWNPLSFVGWEAVPLLGTFAIFCLIGALNWDYESKLLRPREILGGSFAEVHMGQTLFILGLVCSLIAGALLFCLRLLAPRLFGPAQRWPWWILAVPVMVLAAVAAVAANAEVVLGPAALTMMDQMRAVPPANPRAP